MCTRVYTAIKRRALFPAVLFSALSVHGQQSNESVTDPQPEFISGMEMPLHYKKTVIINMMQPRTRSLQVNENLPALGLLSPILPDQTSSAITLPVLALVPLPISEPIRLSEHTFAANEQEISVVRSGTDAKGTTIVTINETHPDFNDPTSLIEEITDPVIEKYAEMISLEPSDISNYPLYRFIDKWYGTRYRWGGKGRRGIDCSAFSQKLYSNVYKTELLRTSRQQHRHCERFRDKDQAEEGDLIFFRVNRIRISHVGIYLANGYFVHASRSHGVMISNLEDTYWRRRYAGCGRVERNDAAPAESDFLQ